MAVTDEDVDMAETRMADLRQAGRAISVRYDGRTGRIVVLLHTGVRLLVPARLLEGVSGASPNQIADVEISPTGLGLHWPSLDADVYVPALLTGIFGSDAWMAKLDAGGRSDDRDRVLTARG